MPAPSRALDSAPARSLAPWRAGPVLRHAARSQLAARGDQAVVACRHGSQGRPRVCSRHTRPTKSLTGHLASRSSCRTAATSGRRKSRSSASRASTSASVGLTLLRGLGCIRLGGVEHHPRYHDPDPPAFADTVVRGPSAPRFRPTDPRSTLPRPDPGKPSARARASGAEAIGAANPTLGKVDRGGGRDQPRPRRTWIPSSPEVDHLFAPSPGSAARASGRSRLVRCRVAGRLERARSALRRPRRPGATGRSRRRRRDRVRRRRPASRGRAHASRRRPPGRARRPP